MNWGDIKSAVREYTHRTDITDALMGVFLAMAEQRIHFGEVNTPKLRIAAMLTKATLADGTLPPGYLEAVKVYPEDSPEQPLHYVPLASMPQASRAFSWEGQTLVLSDDVAFPVEMIYYARLPALSADGDTNWLTDNAPSVYISSLGVEAGDWMRDPSFAQAQAGKYTSAVSSLMSSDKASALSGSPLVIRRKP